MICPFTLLCDCCVLFQHFLKPLQAFLQPVDVENIFMNVEVRLIILVFHVIVHYDSIIISLMCVCAGSSEDASISSSWSSGVCIAPGSKKSLSDLHWLQGEVTHTHTHLWHSVMLCYHFTHIFSMCVCTLDCCCMAGTVVRWKLLPNILTKSPVQKKMLKWN